MPSGPGGVCQPAVRRPASEAGWETDKGELYIRYGRHKSRFGRTAEIRIPHFESWDYGNFQVWFANPISSAWRFEGRRIQRIKINQKRDLIERIQEKFKDPYEWDRFRAPFQVSQFRGIDGQNRFEVYYSLSSQRPTLDARGSGYADFQSLRQGLFTFNTAWGPLYSIVVEVDRPPSVRLEGSIGTMRWGAIVSRSTTLGRTNSAK